MKVERFKSMRLVPRNLVVVAVVRVAGEDFLTGGQGAEDVGATSCLRMGARFERKSRCRNKRHEEKRP